MLTEACMVWQMTKGWEVMRVDDPEIDAMADEVNVSPFVE